MSFFKQIETYKTKCSSVQQKMEKMQEDFQNQTKDFRSKCESVAQLQYQIDLEKKKTSDLQKELHVLQEDIGISRNNQSEPNSIRSNRDFSSLYFL
jgi:chromosome segregation ATPase